MSTAIRWEQPSDPYTTGERGYLGKIPKPVWALYWRGVRNRDDPKVWSMTCHLPGIKKEMHFETVEAAKATADRQLTRFKELIA